ncbi:unnamed protein product, partial [Rotaria magnacalcarata]
MVEEDELIRNECTCFAVLGLGTWTMALMLVLSGLNPLAFI